MNKFFSVIPLSCQHNKICNELFLRSVEVPKSAMFLFPPATNMRHFKIRPKFLYFLKPHIIQFFPANLSSKYLLPVWIVHVKIMIGPDIWQYRIKAGNAELIRPDTRHPSRYCRIIQQSPVRHAGLSGRISSIRQER